MTPREVQQALREVRRRFVRRHRDLESVFDRSYERIARETRTRARLTPQQQRLVGAFFTMEYAIESAALLNPSIVPHPDQSGVPKGSARFLLSLRAIGEGHLSSIVFRRGTIGPRGKMTFDPPRKHAVTAQPMTDHLQDSASFASQLRGMGADVRLAARVLERLPDRFRLAGLQRAIDTVRKEKPDGEHFERVVTDMLWLAQANYSLAFPPESHPSDIVIFPATDNERMGMEDLRLVRFVDEDGRAHYYGTYTAYDGRRIMPMMLDTDDFVTFHVHPQSGRFALNKGAALFPRKVAGMYLTCSRHDGENLFLVASRDLHIWDVSEPLLQPKYTWEALQIGNCGSPVETDAGWILLTHGVGPVREYAIGAALLDRDDPSRIIGRLKHPLIRPTANEREGYVPNVVYSCGAMIHAGQLVIPYAMSDSRSSFAAVKVNDLVNQLIADGP
jgi:predicted GH43/DUF377 family glycosyl hydrolase